MNRTAYTLIELLVVIAIIALLAAILFPVFAQVRENVRRTSCLSNLKQIGTAIPMYAADYDGQFPMGTYSGPRNWEVDTDVDPYSSSGQCQDDFGNWSGYDPGDGGPVFTGCSYGSEFYRALMRVQLYPYTKSVKIWYCPSDRYYTSSNADVQYGLQSYHWFPNWWYNGCCGLDVAYSDTNAAIDLSGDLPSDNVARPAERMLLTERGVYGWDGPDAYGGQQPNTHYDHASGYNVLFFDGHTKLIPYFKKWTTIPATGWPPIF